MRKQKLLTVLLATIILLTTSISVLADKAISVYLDNEKINFDVEPIIVKGRTMVPMRAIFEKLGAEVEWDGETRTAKATRDGYSISIIIGAEFMADSYGKAIKLDAPAMITGGRTLIPLRAVSEAFKCDVKWDGETRTVNIYSEGFIDYSKATGEQTVIKVATPAELIANIGSNRKLLLTSKEYNLSGLDEFNNVNVEKQSGWSNDFLDAYVIKNVINMTIEGKAKIVIDDIYADVLKFNKCGDIKLSGLTIGHTTGNKTYECEGAVIKLDTCENVNIENCNLFGCGAEGLYAENSKGISIDKSKIYDCTYTGIWLNKSDALVTDTEFFYSNHFSGFVRVDNSTLKMENCNIHDIVSQHAGFIESMDFDGPASIISFKKCKFTNNEFFTLSDVSTDNLVFDNCIFEGNKGGMGNYNLE